MQYLLAKMTLASVRHIYSASNQILISSDSRDHTTTTSSILDTLARKHLEKCWAELLTEFGMSSPGEVFEVAYGMIATTKRERGVITVAEADLLRGFFRSVRQSSS